MLLLGHGAGFAEAEEGSWIWPLLKLLSLILQVAEAFFARGICLEHLVDLRVDRRQIVQGHLFTNHVILSIAHVESELAEDRQELAGRRVEVLGR